MSPIANNEHQDNGTGVSMVSRIVIGLAGLGKVFAGCNVTDRTTRWRRNYRCPDVAVYLHGTSAIDRGSHGLGGPDFGVEIVSKGDRCRKKFGFYAKVGTRELLIVDRYPWALELYVLKGTQLELAGRSTVDDP
jgi:Uma2 family endonuclease